MSYRPPLNKRKPYVPLEEEPNDKMYYTPVVVEALRLNVLDMPIERVPEDNEGRITFIKTKSSAIGKITINYKDTLLHGNVHIAKDRSNNKHYLFFKVYPSGYKEEHGFAHDELYQDHIKELDKVYLPDWLSFDDEEVLPINKGLVSKIDALIGFDFGTTKTYANVLKSSKLELKRQLYRTQK